MSYPCFLEQLKNYVIRASINEAKCSHRQGTMPASDAGIRWCGNLRVVLSVEKVAMSPGL